MKLTFSAFLTTFLVALNLSPLKAQETPEPAEVAPPSPPQPFSFAVYDFTTNTPEHTSFYFKNEDSFSTIKCAPLTFSQEYQSASRNPFSIFEAKTTDTPLHFTEFASTTIDKSIKKAIVFLYSNESQKSILVADSSSKGFPTNNLLFINFSKEPVQFLLQGESHNINSLEKELLPYTLSSKGTLKLVVQDENNKNLSVMSIGGRKNQRLIVIFHTLENGSPRLLIERNLDDQSIPITP